MALIEKISAEQIADSRNEPTIKVVVKTSDGESAEASIPSGRSKGTHEALALPAADAIANIDNVLDKKLHGVDVRDQREIDTKMIGFDGTANMSNLGANAILGTSTAVLKSAAASQKMQIYRYVGDMIGRVKFTMPTPIFNVINGGKHAKNDLVFQEFSIVPVKFDKFSDKLEAGKKVFLEIGKLLDKQDISYAYGDEGGYSPAGIKDHKALDYLIDSIENAGYKPGEDFMIALDIAATSITDYDEAVDSYLKLIEKYPIMGLEDPFDEDSWHSWTELNIAIQNSNKKIIVVGDDIFATNLDRLQKGIETNAANAIIVKPNQCGTISEVLSVVMMAKENDYQIVVSHRSGETPDAFIADLAVGVGAEFIKSGAPNENTPERMNKYLRLARIEEEI